MKKHLKKKRQNKRIRLLTNILTALVVGAGAISFWRGAWGLMDLYMFPDNPPLSFVASLFIGIAILYVTRRLIVEFM